MIEAYVGNRPRVITSGTMSSTVALESGPITLNGSIDERRALVLELAAELGLRFIDPDDDARVLELVQ